MDMIRGGFMFTTLELHSLDDWEAPTARMNRHPLENSSPVGPG